MEDTRKTVLAGNGEKDVPRAVYDGVLTIDVDAQVESMEEQEEARWHQLLNAHRTRKILTGQLGGIEKLESGWMVAVTYFNGFRIIIPRLVLSSSYKNVLENKNYVLTNFYMYISASKNGSQYLDSLGGAAGVSASGSYTCNTFLLEAEERREESL